jgi:DNA-binding HxlR family transcriptional regulator
MDRIKKEPVMNIPSGLQVCRALADAMRLAALRALLDRPHYAEELAGRLGLAPSTLTFHLKKLEEAGLVEKAREQYYTVYSARRAALERTLLDLVGGADRDTDREEERLEAYRVKVLRAFVRGGRVERLPVQLKKRRILLEEFAALLEPGRVYPERELNALFARHHDDYCTVRRELIGDGILTRENRQYRLARAAAAPPSRLLAADPEAAPAVDPVKRARDASDTSPAGVFRITNRADGRVFVGRGSGVEGRLKSQRAQLEWGSHRCEALQEDWRRLGPEAFAFEVLETLGEGPGDWRKRLAELERAWLERLQPYGGRGYHKPPRPSAA